VVGILDESDVLVAVTGDSGAFHWPVRDFMTNRLQTVYPTVRIEELLPVFAAGHVVIVTDEVNFYGLITRVDPISHLRRQHQQA
jgi:cystathionine beta-synthase